MSFVLDLDDVYSVFNSADGTDLGKLLKANLNIKIPGAEYLWSFKSGQWDGTVNLWDEASSRLLRTRPAYRVRTGLVPRVMQALYNQQIPVSRGYDTRAVTQSGSFAFSASKLNLRDYQRKALAAALQNTVPGLGWWPRGVLEMATGSGKTETAVAMYETNPVSTMFLVHRKDLLLQAAERFKKYGHTVGIIGAGTFDPNSKLNIATMQTVISILKDPLTPKGMAMLKLIGLCRQLFVDECHLAASSLEKGNEFVGVVDQFSHASFRWGLTATPFMRGSYDNALLEGVTGPSLFQITSKQLVDMGFLTPPTVIIRDVPGALPVKIDWKRAQSNKARGEHWRLVEEMGIKFNEVRTRIIIEEIQKGPHPCLVLVKTVEQANFIRSLYASATGKTLPFLSGKDSAADRRAGIKGLNDGKIPAIIATTIFDEGVDVPALAKVILASGGKSQVKLIQRVGRSLRTHAGKKEAIIIDFADGHNGMLKAHAEERRKVWRAQEFKVVNG